MTYDGYDERDEAPVFPVVCACGVERRSDEDCPNCQGASLSYASEDARHWNDWVDHPERYGASE